MTWSGVRIVGVPFALGFGALVVSAGCKSIPYTTSSGSITTGSGSSGGVGGPIPFDASFPTGISSCGSTMPTPTFGSMCTASTPPPPISGGTILVTKNGLIVVISDPDRDAIYVVDISKGKLLFSIALQAGDEPGRLAEDAAGLVHVALRSGGALVTINPTTGAIVERRSVCPAPRGVAYDSGRDVVWVACATGELVGFPAAGGPATTNWVIERDLRDVLVSATGALTVSEFRSAQLLALNSDGTIASRTQAPAPDGNFTPHVLWRTIPGPGGSTLCIHQEHSNESIDTAMPGGYGGSNGCGGGGSSGGLVGPEIANPGALFFDAGSSPSTTFDGEEDGSASAPPALASLPQLGTPGPIASVLTLFSAAGSLQLNQTIQGVLPVDIAVSFDGSTFAVASPGSAFTQSAAFVLSPEGGQVPLPFPDVTQVPIAVGFDILGDVLAQVRDPGLLWVFPQLAGPSGTVGAPFSIPLSTVSACDTGHDIFHTHAGVGIACASCHPEGGDDGHVWVLDNEQRRTPSLRGTIAGTAPYHWPGDEPNLPTLVNDVYTVRMAGQPLESEQMSALTGWVQTLPPPPAPSWVNASAAAAGRAIFNNATVACATCHSGPKFTNNSTVDVGTGGAFQVPPLVGVGWRTPLLHTGCATTMADRFGACSTTEHGNISSLSATDLENLEAYLETL